MAVETGIIGLISRALGWLFSLFAGVRKRRQAQGWVGVWEGYTVVGRNLGPRMQGGTPATVALPKWWKFSTKLTFECYDLDGQGRPARQQIGHISIDDNNPATATRVGRYTDSAEVYEQRLTMLDTDTILIIPVPERSTLGDVYAKHGWRRKTA